MRPSVRNTLLGSVAAAALAASVAWAQTPPAPPPAPPQDMRAQRFAQMCKEIPAIRASRLAYLEVKLALTDQQRTAWNSFAQDMRAAGEPMRKMCENPPKADAQADAVTMLTAREQFLTVSLESTKLARAATEKLQAVLTPEQKVTLAEYTRRAAGRGMGGPHHHMRGGMHHGPAAGPPAGGPAPR